MRRGRANDGTIYHGPFIVREIVNDICKVQAIEGKKEILEKRVDELLKYEPHHEISVGEEIENIETSYIYPQPPVLREGEKEPP